MVTTHLFDHVVKQRALDIDDFLTPKWPDHLHDPMLFKGMDVATQRIWQAINAGEKIGIVGDYDMDGTPGAALLTTFFRRLGHEPLVILPHRDEGYGFSVHFAERLCSQGVRLIITVDCGIRDEAAVALAGSKGCDVIITDHHECGETLPSAFAIINPKQPDCPYPFKGLAGTGVAFKLAQGLIQTAPVAYKKKVPETWLAWSLDFVLLATISDMVPLQDENRLFAHYGLKVLHKTSHIGLQRFVEALNGDLAHLSYQDIAYKLIPKFNACGRMGSMEPVLTLLTSSSVEEADKAVQAILVQSTQSQLLLTEMLTEARVQAEKKADVPLVMVSQPHWHPGLTGLVATKLAEELKRPVGVFALAESTYYRGSFRGGAGINFPVLLTQAQEHVEKFGGHAQAAGLTVAQEKLSALEEKLVSLYQHQAEADGVDATTEGTILPEHIALPALELLDQLAPWGMGHEEPLWSMRGVHFDRVQWLSDGAHLKGEVVLGTERAPFIFFGAQHMRPLVEKQLDICGTVSINEFKGTRRPQFTIRSAVASEW